MTKLLKNKKVTGCIAVILAVSGIFAGCSAQQEDQPIPVKVLILPKFEVGELTGDFPGEAQLFYLSPRVPRVIL